MQYKIMPVRSGINAMPFTPYVLCPVCYLAHLAVHLCGLAHLVDHAMLQALDVPLLLGRFSPPLAVDKHSFHSSLLLQSSDVVGGFPANALDMFMMSPVLLVLMTISDHTYPSVCFCCQV